MYFFITLLTAVALSLDAFSLSIIYGTILEKRKTIIILSAVVGIFHFFMPLIGHFLSNLLLTQILTKTNIISFIIFLILGIEMFFNNSNDKNLMKLSNFLSILIFAFTVSIDSFSIGIAISNESILIPIILFSTISCLFTYFGLYLGKKLKNILGNITTQIGGIILILLSFYYLFT